MGSGRWEHSAGNRDREVRTGHGQCSLLAHVTSSTLSISFKVAHGGIAVWENCPRTHRTLSPETSKRLLGPLEAPLAQQPLKLRNPRLFLQALTHHPVAVSVPILPQSQ